MSTSEDLYVHVRGLEFAARPSGEVLVRDAKGETTFYRPETLSAQFFHILLKEVHDLRSEYSAARGLATTYRELHAGLHERLRAAEMERDQLRAHLCAMELQG